ncbi:FUN14 family-domain-containing protein [Leucosporidium creatinivorum]|uniref:FUN14 family-domain-containing protein n=1 Tax=Leucosporidium creatinivorum TaxID=106004 RepID=A0A1Y2G047_9BASI|nr:FUN14 family-domain-containing protein [Leucosporidium creatinivorum]
MLAARWPTPLATLLRHAPRPSAPSSILRQRTLCTSTPTFTPRSASFLNSYRTALALVLPTVALGVGLSSKDVECASDRSYATPAPPANVLGGTPADAPEAESIINLRDLSFGTVSGICVGIFVKKGLKAVAFALGGVFVLMQYFSSRSFISINWGALTSSYDSFITKRAGPSAAEGGNRIVGLSSAFLDFITANVQSRATFVAGIVLGFRLG